MMINDDRELKISVEAALAWEPNVEEAHIGVAAQDGVVTLSGYVPSCVERWSAEQAVKRVPGVRGVVSKIEVKVPGKSRLTDVDLAASAVGSLKSHASVPADRTKVTVAEGWITLEGVVEWQYQQEATEDAVRSLTGVVGITNMITVHPQVQPQDLKRKIEDAFRRTALLDASRIDVELEGGRVTLRGTVSSLAEKEAAERQSWAAPGVTEVRNLLTVESVFPVHA
jgi:osmotically-inducible protein OsmY